MRLHVKNFILYDILENIDFLRFFMYAYVTVSVHAHWWDTHRGQKRM